MNIHEKILEFLMLYKPEEFSFYRETYTVQEGFPFADWYFNTNRAEVDTINVIPISGVKYIEEWIGGGGICTYDFAINIFKATGEIPCVDVSKCENMINLYEVQEFMNWIEEQDAKGNYPALGEGYFVQKLEVLQDIPQLTAQYENLTKITFTARITYMKEEEY